MRFVNAGSLKYWGALGGFVALAALAADITSSGAKRSSDDYASTAGAAASGAVVPVFGIGIPVGYRDWKLITVAREKGNLNDLRATLGNDPAIKAYRENAAVFPDGSIIARIAWNYIPSEDNDKVLGKPQSFVAGPAAGLPNWYLEFMVKDSKKYASTGGWGYAQFDKDGKPAGEALMKTCAPCHQVGNQVAHAHDFVFSRYTP
jgi:hypothetical protein